MSSIIEEIIAESTKSERYLRSSRNALIARGGEISPTAGLKDLPNAIYNIPADSSLAFPSDDTVAYRKIVPVGAEQMARVETLGGMTYKCKNLIPFPYADGETKTHNGITFTVNKDGSITANGTATANAYFNIVRGWANFNLPKGDYYISGVPSGGGGDTYRMNIAFQTADGTSLVDILETGEGRQFNITEDASQMYFKIDIFSGVTVNNITFRPMLNAGTTALPYEPYFEGLRSAKVTSLKSEGANLIPFPYDVSTITQIGLTATANNDGSIRLQGTATEVGRFNGYFLNKRPVFIAKGTPVSIAGMDGSTYSTFLLRVSFHDKDSKSIAAVSTADNVKTITLEADCYYMYLDINYWTTTVGEEVDITFSPMLNYGSTAAPFTPYRGTLDTLAIPEAVQSLTDYGEGVSADYNNHIKFAEKKYRQEAQRIVFDGHEDIFIQDRGDYREYYINLKRQGYANSPTNSNNIELVSTKYRATSRNYQYDHPEEMGIISITSQFLRWNDVYMTAEEMQAKLKAWYDEGNPLVVVRALAEPIETDISAYLTSDGFFKVQGGGTVVAENEYEYAVPSKINYVQKVGI